MKRKGDIASFFVKRHKGPDQAEADPDQAEADPNPATSSPGSSQPEPGASQASQGQRQGPSLPPPGQNIQTHTCVVL